MRFAVNSLYCDLRDLAKKKAEGSRAHVIAMLPSLQTELEPTPYACKMSDDSVKGAPVTIKEKKEGAVAAQVRGPMASATVR